MNSFDPDNDVDKGIYEVNGATDELSRLVDWVNNARVDEVSLRNYLNERIELNMKRAKEIKIQHEIKKAEFEKKS